MRARWPSLVALAGLVIALAAMVWPVRAHQAMWAVTVGNGLTNSVPVGGGALVTPIQVIIEGTDPQETALRSTIERRIVLAFGAAALAIAAGIVGFARALELARAGRAGGRTGLHQPHQGSV